MLVLGSTLNFLLIHENIENGIFQCCSSWGSQFFPIHERDGKFGFLFISVGRLFFTEKLKNWDF